VYHEPRYPAQEPPPGAPQATPQFASAPQPRRSALRAPRPRRSPLIFLSPLTFIPLPSRSQAAPRAEPTAAPRAVPEAQPPLLLEPHQRELLAAAIMGGGGRGGCWGRRAGTGEPRWRPLVPDLALRAPSCGGYRRKTRPTPSFPHEASTQSSSATTSQGYVLPEGKIMPNTVFVGGIDVRMDETEIRSFFARYGSVKEVKIITDRTGVSKGYGFVSFYNDVDVQKIVESQINFHGKKLKLGPAIRKQNLCAYHVQPRPLVFNPPPPPQFQSVWSNPNTETYMQPPTMMNPITQYVQAYPSYPSSPVQVITGYQLPVYNYQMPPQWPAGEQRSYVIPQAYTAVNYHCNEVDPGAEVLQSECSKSVDRSIQTVVSCLFNPENRLRNSLVTQDEYFKPWTNFRPDEGDEKRSFRPGTKDRYYRQELQLRLQAGDLQAEFHFQVSVYGSNNQCFLNSHTPFPALPMAELSRVARIV
ncbi:hypothetical protein GH733_002597, partial [Mirounga leonina]